MALARIYTALNNLIIRNIGDTGGPSSSRVDEELNQIIAWAKDARRNIHTNTTVTGNVGAGLDVLHTFSLNTPNRLTTNGDYLDVFYAGDFTANDTNKQVQAFFAGTAYENTGVIDIDGSSGWVIMGRIVRLSSTSVRIHHLYTVNQFFTDSTGATVTSFGESFFCVTRRTDLTGLSDLGANATTMEVKGEGAANDDVTQTMSIIELRQQ